MCCLRGFFNMQRLLLPARQHLAPRLLRRLVPSAGPAAGCRSQRGTRPNRWVDRSNRACACCSLPRLLFPWRASISPPYLAQLSRLRTHLLLHELDRRSAEALDHLRGVGREGADDNGRHVRVAVIRQRLERIGIRAASSLGRGVLFKDLLGQRVHGLFRCGGTRRHGAECHH